MRGPFGCVSERIARIYLKLLGNRWLIWPTAPSRRSRDRATGDGYPRLSPRLTRPALAVAARCRDRSDHGTEAACLVEAQQYLLQFFDLRRGQRAGGAIGA